MEVLHDVLVQTAKIVLRPCSRFRCYRRSRNWVLAVRVEVELEERVVLRTVIIWIAEEAPGNQIIRVKFVRHSTIDFVVELVTQLSGPVHQLFWFSLFRSR
jgi:hypothetical protein